MNENIKENILEEFKRLWKKAELTREIHGRIGDSCKRWKKFLNLYVIVGSACSAMLIFANFKFFETTIGIPEGVLQLLSGLLSASVFITGLVLNFFNYDLEIQKRRKALNRWTKWIRESQWFINTGMEQLGDDEIEERKLKLLHDYSTIASKGPPTPNGMFLKSKKKHLMKIEISKALDNDPFISIWKYKLSRRFKGPQKRTSSSN